MNYFLSFSMTCLLMAYTFTSYELKADESDMASNKIIRGPYLQNLNQTGVIIRWETTKPSSSQIELEGNLIGEQTPTIKHKVILSDLEAGRRYSYKLINISKSYFFTTAHDDPERPYKFAVWADSQSNPDIFKKVAETMLDFNPDFAMGVGDYADNGADLAHWNERFFSPASEFLANVPTFLALGNHDYGMYGNNRWDFTPTSPGLKLFQNFFEGPMGTRTYYSFNYGQSHFIVLDPNLNNSLGAFDINPSSEQYKWLIDDLNSNASKCARFRFMFFHEPAFINYWDGGYWDGEPLLRKNLVPIIEKYKIDMAFSGHAHLYERGVLNGVTYITTGGGGGYLERTQYRDWEHIMVSNSNHHFTQVQVNGNHVEYTAVTPEGIVLDHDVITSQGGCQ